MWRSCPATLIVTVAGVPMQNMATSGVHEECTLVGDPIRMAIGYGSTRSVGRGSEQRNGAGLLITTAVGYMTAWDGVGHLDLANNIGLQQS